MRPGFPYRKRGVFEGLGSVWWWPARNTCFPTRPGAGPEAAGGLHLDRKTPRRLTWGWGVIYPDGQATNGLLQMGVFL